MKVKKLLTVLCTALALALCFAFAACNGDKEPDPAPATEYTVTFDANGGTLTGNATVKVESGKTISGAPSAAKAEHDFAGWYTLATDGDKIDLSTYKVTKDVTLYAHYTAKTVTPPTPSTKIEVTFDANGGTIEGENKIKIEVDENGLIMDQPEATREGHRFDAWYSAAEGGEPVDPMFDEITESTTLYAHWIKTYVVTFDAGEGTLTGEETFIVDENEKVIGAPSAVKPGDEFHGWYTEAEGGDKVDFDTFTVTEDVTLYAHFGVITMPVKNLKDHEGTAVGYRIEAEEAKITGAPSSDNQANPGTHFENVPTASGGKSIGYLGTVGKTITFTFNSATAGKANISLRATSNNTKMEGGWQNMWVDDQTVTTKDFTVSFNGNPVNFQSATLRGAGKDKPMTWNLYWDPVALGELDVAEGLNSLVITVAAKTVPNMDCLDIETTLNITSANGDAASGESTLPAPPAPDVVYDGEITVDLVVGAYDGGPAMQKAILNFGTQDITAENITSADFYVNLGGKLGGQTDKVYLCDEDGEKVTATSSNYVAIEYTPTFNQWGIDGGYSVFDYNQTTNRNSWKDFTTVSVGMNGTLTIDSTEYNKMGTENVSFGKRIIPSIDNIWDVNGSYTKGEGDGAITLKYASYGTDAMKSDSGKNPLIIWLHGAGEGGSDPTITLLGNKVTALAGDGIQKYFTVAGGTQGAYVLAPQSPTMWMDKGNDQQGDSNVGKSIYADALWELIQEFVTNNPDIDTDRIYIGGCSNGGFMTMQMIELHPDYFAAAFPIATPYNSTPELINAIKNLPIWFTHAKNDTTVPIGEWQSNPQQWWLPATFVSYSDANTNAIYIDLLEAGATNVHYSLFENVKVGSVDYSGHYSWIWVFNDQVKNVQATQGAEGAAFALTDLNEKSTATVTVNGEAATLWAWIAAQAKTPAEQA